MPYAQRWPGPKPWRTVSLRAADPASVQGFCGHSMGTGWSVRLHNRRFLPLEDARLAVQESLDLVIAQMSHWAPDSCLARFGRAAAGSWHTLPPEFFSVLECALHWAAQSGGAFDPTVAPLVAAWGFGPRAGVRELSAAGRCARQARPRVGWQQLALRPATREARQPGGVQLDLSAIAKGYAVDLICQRLQALGHRDFLVEIGGEARAVGRRPGGQPWRVLLAPGGRSIALQDCAIATSGDQWQVWEENGCRHSHSLDPRRGRPVAHDVCSVSVLHQACMPADALATALIVLGPHEGLAFAEQRGMAALFCRRTPQGLAHAMTRALADLLP